MRKTMVYILALTMLCAALLSGCGEAGDARRDENPSSTGVLSGLESMMPDAIEPDARDGEVDDTDGVITEREDAREDNTGILGTDGDGAAAAGENGAAGSTAAKNNAGSTAAR